MAWIEGIRMMYEYLFQKIFRNFIKGRKGCRLWPIGRNGGDDSDEEQ